MGSTNELSIVPRSAPFWVVVEPIETFTVFEMLPPAPVHASVYVFADVSGPTVVLPERAFVPVHAPEAVHDVALVLVHVSVELPPEATVVGLPVKLSVGAGFVGGEDETLTVTLFCAELLLFEHLSV
jgi:hypothetical protein